MEKDSSLYRPCVGLALFNGEGKVFVGERIDFPGEWQMPQGGIDEGESVEVAALREMREEIGTSQARILRIAEEPLRYDVPPDLAKRFWGGRYRGQEQTWVALRFTGRDEDINIKAHEPPEFARWRWVPLAETPDLIVSFKRETYAQVVRIFADLAKAP